MNYHILIATSKQIYTYNLLKVTFSEILIDCTHTISKITVSHEELAISENGYVYNN